MTIDIPLELDSGPITWVKAEIDSALYRALEGIDKLRSTPTAELRTAVRADLHQVAGALELVGIEGLAVLVQEFERHFGNDVDIVPREALDLVDRGCRRLLSHLKEMTSGSPPVPLRFISEYLALGKLRRAKYGPADLFFPDLSRRPARLVNVEPPEPSRMPAFLLRHRRDFQQGLLQWLRGSEAGLDQMRKALAEIEAAYPLPSQRSFWWATRALLEAAQSGLIESSTALKQLMARVDLQVRRFVEGSTRVADRLRREVLYHVARARSGNPLVDEVKALYELDVLVPKRVPREIDVVALQPSISALHAIVTRCKDAWTSLNAGRSNAFAKLREATAELPAACDALRMPEFSSLGRGIANAALSVTEGKVVGDDLSIEFATSLILIETALEHIAALPSSFRAQVDRALQRLVYAATNAPIPVELRSEHEDNSLTRLAQEKQTISQVAKEIRANMRLVEQALDAVFRDRNATDELKPLPALLGQVSGAMRMLGWNDANELLTKTSDRLIESVKNDASLSTQDIDSLADVLAGLSFYVDVRERRDRDADEILAGLKRRFFGEAQSPAAVGDEESVEASLAERQRMLKPLARALTDEPNRTELRDTLRSTLQGVRQDAELLSDPGLSEASNEALRLLDAGGAHSAALSAAVAAVVGGTTELPPTSAETSRLVESRPEERDEGLLEIFVEEATEVVDAVCSHHAELVLQHDHRDALVDVRRAFHTLKGSGRMVGQADLAEVAWRVERVLNTALEQDRPVSEPELKLVAAAAEKFGGWIDALRAKQGVSIDVNVLDPLIERCGQRSPTAAPPLPALPPLPTLTPPAMATPVATPPVQAPLAGSATEVDFDALLAESPASPPAHDELGLMGLMPEQSAALSLESLTTPSPTPAGEDVFEHELINALNVHDDELHVLGVPVSRALFSLLTDETRVHLQTLEYELTLMQFDTSLLPSDSMVRASHTLCGIHRTAGFLSIGDFAGVLESALIAVRRTGRSPSAVGALASAVQSLRTATLRLQANSPMSPEELADQERARKQLHELVAQSGDADLGVEGELLQQTHDEEEALTHSSVTIDHTAEPLPALLDDAPVGLAAEHPLELAPLDTTAHDVAPQKTSAPVGAGAHLAAPIEHAAALAPAEAPASPANAWVMPVAPTTTPAPMASHAPAAPAATAAPTAPTEPDTTAAASATPATPVPSVTPVAPAEPAEPNVPAAPVAAHSPALSDLALVTAGVAAPTLIAAAALHEPSPPAIVKHEPPVVAAPPREPAAVPAEVSPPPTPAAALVPPVAASSAAAEPAAAAGDAPASVSLRVSAQTLPRADAPTDHLPMPPVPARAPQRVLEDPLADIRDDIDEQVLPIFIEEAQELYPQASEHVTSWRRDAQDASHSEALKRTLHTLKGSARMAGAMRLGELAHSFETCLIDVSGSPTPAVFDSFDEYLDDIAFLLERLTHGEKDVVLPRYAAPVAEAEALATDVETPALDHVGPTPTAATAHEAAAAGVTPAAATLAGAAALAAAGTATAATVAAAPSVSELAQRLAVRPPVTAQTAQVTPQEAAGATAFLRVRSDSVEQLADEAGEISINRSRIEAEMRNLKAGLLDLTASVVRLRGQLREIEIQGESQIQSRLDQESQFDPLEFDRYTRFQELTRGLAEGVNDVATVQQSLLKNLADADTALSTQTRLSRSVQLRLQTLRTVPFSNLSDRLYRVLRQTAKDLKKRANLDIRGGRLEIDRSVLERLTPVLEHLVRNSLAHGIESDAIRRERGKPEIGEMSLSVRQQGNEVAISLTDDGGGIPLDKVRARAVAQGLIAPDAVLSESQLLEFIFQSGFSTAEQVTAVAGRGVGMDVVRNEVTGLGGRVEVHSTAGVGTTFTLSVPLTLAVTQVLLVGVGKFTFGIPSSLIDQVRQVPVNERAAALASGTLMHGGAAIAYRSLAALTRVQGDVAVARTVPVMMLRSGDVMAAVAVDRIINNQEVVAKPYGPQLARVPGLAGLTVLADGTITLLLNPINLIITQEGDVPRLKSSSTTSQPSTASSASTASTASVASTTSAAPASMAVVASPVLTSVGLASSVPESASQPAMSPSPVAVPATPPTHEAAAANDVIVPLPVARAPEPSSAPVAPTASAFVAAPVAAEPPSPPAAPVLAFTQPAHRDAHIPVAPAEVRPPLVLVVDDSLTVRKITTRLLEREGYRALTAKDGLDALQVLADNNPDVILLDIEMPRMDGFEFTKTLKADDRQSHIPIIMITSRTAEKHRSHAAELGVNEYVGKPYQDEQLLALISKYAGKPG